MHEPSNFFLKIKILGDWYLLKIYYGQSDRSLVEVSFFCFNLHGGYFWKLCGKVILTRACREIETSVN